MQPKILSQRLKIAQDFVNEFGIGDEIPLVVDDMRGAEGELCAAQHDNPVDAAYAMWPTRFYVVQGGAVQFKAEPTKEHEVSACQCRHSSRPWPQPTTVARRSTSSSTWRRSCAAGWTSPRQRLRTSRARSR